MVEGRAVYAPERAWVAVLLLAGHLFFPAAVWAICLFTDTPTGAAIDWRGESVVMRAVNTLLYAHALYAAALVVGMRGWRVHAGCLGTLLLLVGAVTNFFAYFTVTGVYW